MDEGNLRDRGAQVGSVLVRSLNLLLHLDCLQRTVSETKLVHIRLPQQQSISCLVISLVTSYLILTSNESLCQRQLLS